MAPSREKWVNYILVGGLALVYILGLFVEVMDVDAAMYASISREMQQSGDWLQVHYRHMDYLDKPPLLFWLSAFSFKLFGISEWSYKLPTVLFSIAGLYATYRLGKLLYNKTTGLTAALILASTYAWFLFNNDVRTDSLLASAVIISIWLLQEYRQNGKWLYLLGGFTAIALAMMAKGPIGMMVPAIAIGCDLLFRREWKKILDWRWLAGIAFAFLLLTPMLYGLYHQYDMHPEKNVNGASNVSGLKFFFWTQSFGRITGENTWHNDDSPSLFFFHTFLWSYAPWTLLFIPAFIHKIKILIRKSVSGVKPEILTLSGFIIPLIILSFSHYKLPHYIFVIYPLAAVMTAGYLLAFAGRIFKITQVIQTIILCILWAGIFLVITFIFPTQSVINFLRISLALLMTIVMLVKSTGWKKIFYPTIFSAIGAGIMMNAVFYPALLKYQPADKIAEDIKTYAIAESQLASFKKGSEAIGFYTGYIIPNYNTIEDLEKVLMIKKELWVFTNRQGMEMVKLKNYDMAESEGYINFRVSVLTTGFLNPATRNSYVDSVFLLHVFHD